MKKAGEDVTNEDLKALKEIGRDCYACQKFAASPRRNMASAPDECRFNHEIVMDIMHIRGRPVLQIVCIGAKFAVAAYIANKKAETVWSALLKIWIRPCAGTPHIIRVDQGSQFLGKDFEANCKSLGIYLDEAPIESPNSMGIGERFHDPLRRIALKVKEEAPDLDDDLVLSAAYRAMNDTLGPEGLAPTLLVYGMLPRMPIGSKSLSAPNQVDRMKALSIARGEMEEIVAKLRVKSAMDHNLPASLLDEENVAPGMLAMIYRKNLKCWDGPFELVRIEGKPRVLRKQ